MTTRTWNGTSGSFDNASDWTPNGIPTVGDIAVITAGTVTATGDTLANLQVQVGTPSSGTATLALVSSTIGDGATVTLEAGDTGTVQLTNATIGSGGALNDAALGASFAVSGTVTNAGALSFSASPASVQNLTIASNAALVNTGTITVNSSLQLSGTGANAAFENDGTISSSGRTFISSSPVTGTGTILLNGQTGFDAQGAVGTGQTISFAPGAAGIFEDDSPSDFAGVISGFVSGDLIVLTNLPPLALSYSSTGATSGVLTLTAINNGTTLARLRLTGFYTISNFGVVFTDLGGGLSNTQITTNATTPVIAGTVANQPVSDAATLDPFANVTVTDANTGQTETATLTPSTTGNGVLTDPNAASDGGTTTGGVLTLSGSASQVTADLNALVFTPIAHQVAPGGTVTTGFTLAVTNTLGSTASDATTSIVATAAEDPPVIGGTSATPQLVPAGTVLDPFAAVTVTDPDFGASETTAITVTSAGAATDSAGVLSGTGLTHTGVGTYQLAAGSPASEQAALRAVVFTPDPSVGAVLNLALSVSDGIGPAVTDTKTTVQSLPSAVSPVLGAPNEFNSTSSANVTNTVTTTVAKTDDTASTTITAVLDGNQIVFQQTFALPYSDSTVQAAVAQADAILSNDGATPSAPSLASSTTTNQGSTTTTTTTGQQTGAPATTVSTDFGPGTVSVGPSGAQSFTLLAGQIDFDANTVTTTTVNQTATTTTTTLTTQQYAISGSNDAYSIAGARAAQLTTDAAAIAPFAGVTVTNPDTAAIGTATVTLSPSGNGTLSNLGGGALVGGAYSVTGTTAAIQAALQGLVYTPTPHEVPPGQSVTTGFALTVSDGASTAMANASVVATALPSPVVSSPSILVAENSAAVPIGIAAPTDPAYASRQLAIAALTLPADGVVALANGMAVTAGQSLTSTQLTGLTFTPTTGQSGTSSTFTYEVTDPANSSSTGIATLAIATPPAITSDTASPASGTEGVGQVITFTLTASAPVTVTGSPSLALNDGGTAAYVEGSGTTSLVFATTVAAGQNAAALAVTGVTLPAGSSIQDSIGEPAVLTGANVTFPGLRVSGSATGDVHMVTLDGLHYDFQADGDFTLERSTVPGNPFDIQIRTAPWAANRMASLVTQAAAHLGRDVIGFTLDGSVTVDGVTDTALSAARPVQALDGGTLTALGGGAYRLDWAAGESLSVSNEGYCLDLTTTVAASDGPGSVQGLLGNLTGQANDLALPDGTVLVQPVPEAALLGVLADAWRVAPGASLLDGGAFAAGTLGMPAAPTFLRGDAPGEVAMGSLGGSSPVGETIAGSLATLAHAVVTDLATRNLIDVIGLNPAFATVRTPTTPSGSQLTIEAGSHAATATLLGSGPAPTVHAASDQHGDTLMRFG